MFNIKSLARMAICTALIVVCSWLTVPFTVPFTMQTFAIFFTVCLLGPWQGMISILVYILLGAVGVPVFAGFGSGPAVLFGKTGGYIIGYILCAAIVGLLSRRLGFTFPKLCLSMVIGVAVCYVFGTAWFMVISGLNLATSLSYCVLPFLPGDAVKILLAAFLALRLRKPLQALS